MGRLFFHRTAAGTIDGVCSTGKSVIECTDLLGIDAPALEANLRVLENQLPAARKYTAGMGVYMYHPPSNRVFLSTPRKESRDLCWDFTTGFCGELYGITDHGPTEDYGFIYEGNCLFALGDQSIFWSFTIDFEPGCRGTATSARLDKCTCGAEVRWPNPFLEFDVGPGTPFTLLDIQIQDPGGNVVWPSAGGWASMVGHPTGTIDLTTVPTTHEYLTVKVVAELDPAEGDPWAAGDPPTLRLGLTQIPHLVE